MLILLGFADINFGIEQGTARSTYFCSAAITLSSITIGAGNAEAAICKPSAAPVPS